MACYGPGLAERANVVIELFIIYKDYYSSYNGSFWCSDKIPQYIFSKNVLHTPVILQPRITIVSGRMINGLSAGCSRSDIWRTQFPMEIKVTEGFPL